MAYIRGEVYCYVDFNGIIHIYTPIEHFITQDGHEAVRWLAETALYYADKPTIAKNILEGVMEIFVDIQKWGPDARKWYANVRENTKTYTRS